MFEGSVETSADIAFRETTERTLYLDVHRPANRDEETLPVLCLLRGQGWRPGEYPLDDYICRLGSEGFAVATANYRLADEAPFPAALTDAKAAIRWLRREGDTLGVDADRITVAGHAGGAGLAALVAATPDDPRYRPESANRSDRVSAAVCLAGRYDRVGERDRASSMQGEFVAADRDRLATRALASPVRQATSTTASTMLCHGTADDRAPISGAERYLELLQSVGVDTDLFRATGAGHTFPFEAPWPGRLSRAISRFLRAQQ